MSEADLAVQLELAGAPIAAVGTRRIELTVPDALLLAWLALEGPTPRERIAALLRPGSDADAARNALRQRLFRLRRQLGADVVSGGTVLALAPRVGHDLGHDPGPDAAPAPALLGTLQAPEWPELDAWLGARREAARAAGRRALNARIEALEAAGDAAAALPLALQGLEAEPLSEDAHRRVIRLHYLAGDRAAALLAFDRCERMLKDEVGAAPSTETLALLRLVEAGAAPAPPPAASGWQAPLPAAVLRPPRMVGRDAELGELAAAWGRGARVLVVGEAGIGKSRLLAALGERQGGAARGVAIASARPGDALVPYASGARLLRAVLELAPAALEALPRATRARLAPLLPGVATEPGPPTATSTAPGSAPPPRGALAEPTRDLFAAAAPPLSALVLDDLHFADDATLDWLQSLLDFAPGPWRWALGLRPPAAGSRLAALLEALARSGPQLVQTVQPLAVPQLAALVDSLALPGVDGPTLAPALARRSGGNPLFALETLKLAWQHGRFELDAGLPQAASLAALIGEQLGRLSPPALALARVAAVAGPDFSLELAERVLQQDALALADPWLELEQQRVLVPGSAEFAHDLVYEAVLAGLPALIARALHGRIAGRLEAAGGEPARIAAHWEAAGQRERALPALRAAAEQAHRALREHERIAILLRAADIADSTGQRAVAFDCVARAVESHMNSIREAGGFPLLDRLDALADSAAERARALGMRAWYLTQLPDHDAAVRVGEQALALAEPLGERSLIAPIRQRLATSLSMLARFEEALAHMRAVEAWADADLAPDDRAEFHGNFAVMLDNLGHPEEASTHHQVAIGHSAAAADHAQRVTHLANHAVNRLNAGDVATAAALVRQAQALVASYELQGASVAFLWLLRSQAARALGDYADALTAADQALDLLAQHNPTRQPLVWVQRAQVWLELGQVARAGQDLQAAAPEALPPHVAARRLLLQSRWQQALGAGSGGAEAAGVDATLAAALAAAPGAGWPEVRMTIELEQALRQGTHDPAAALMALRALQQAAAARGLLGTVQAAQMHAARLGAALTRPTAAADAAEDAAADAAAAWARAEAVLPTLRPRVEVFTCVAAGLAVRDAAAAHAVLAAGRAWLETTANERVPEPFRDGFLQRAPGVAALRALAVAALP